MAPVREHPVRRKPLVRVLATMLAATLLTLGMTVATNVTTAAPAHALCSTPAIVGTWSNIDSTGPAVAKVEFRYTCSDTVICDAETGICTRPPSILEMRPFGQCSPTLCDWGWRQTVTTTDGWHWVSYRYSWATRSVRARTESWYGLTYLHVLTRTDFTDGRTDYETNEWFLK
ncbi:hypothetical protein V6U90_18560 [Micromonospora sp. CPCC 206060]|uniref:hypothetical protein n=1 Tax=Micromonospora sp. CPCC 206060 TaxID=3122406 RepID=UPI002FF35C58